MAHSILAFRAGGIVNGDDSSAVSSVADRGQSLPDAGAGTAVNFTLSNESAIAPQASAFAMPQAESVPMVSRAGSIPVFLQVDSAPGAVTAFHNDPSSTVSTGSAGLTLVFSNGTTSTPIFGPIADASDGGSAGLVTFAAALPSDGWFVVPSASNEYGDTQVAAAGDGFSFDVATGEFTAAADWFIV